MSAEEIEDPSSHKVAPLAVMVPKNDDNIVVNDGEDFGNTDQRQTDDCEEFQGRVQTILDGIGKTYSPFEEDLPRLPAYTPSFNMVEKLCIGLVKEAQTLLNNARYQDEETARLIQLASESQTIQYPPARKVGLIGDSAAGESWLLWQCPLLLIKPRQEHVGQRLTGFPGACTGGWYRLLHSNC